MVSMRYGRKVLALVWLIGVGILLVILVLQTILGRYDAPAKPEDAFAWLLPNVIPTVSLIVGVLVADVVNVTDKNLRVDRFMYRLALGMSVIYLTVVSLTIFLAPFATRSPVELMKTSQLWLSPLQGIVAAVIGVFFVKKTSNN
jgi:hypothetical protein